MINFRTCSDRVFESIVHMPRTLAQEIMLATYCSPLPARAMAPGARLVGGDLPVGPVDWARYLELPDSWKSSATCDSVSGVCDDNNDT